MSMNMKDEVVARFLRYVKIDTQSDENSGTHPSSRKQLDLARLLVSELAEMGAVPRGEGEGSAVGGTSETGAATCEPAGFASGSCAKSTCPKGAADFSFDEENGYIYCTIYENLPELAIGDDLTNAPKIGFIAHMDTSPEASGADVKPRIIENYDGGDIALGDLSLRPSEFPELLKYKGQTLITSDGTTLLGSDDKSGIAEIMTMANYFLTHPEVKHGRICIAFTPDEEIGEGTLNFDLGKFGADFAYTVDGGELGELSYENFNAASAVIKVTGRNVHPGEAYGKMIHAARLAMEIDSKLPSKERPELTRDHEGFYHLTEMRGDASEASLVYILRDHDAVLFAKKKETVEEVCAQVEAAHPGAKVEVTIRDSYFNMIDKIRPHMEIVARCEEAMRRCGITPRIEPIRGGTDGAMLSYRGLLCPNICAGGHNFHGVYEYVSCEAMAKICELLIELARG